MNNTANRYRKGDLVKMLRNVGEQVVDGELVPALRIGEIRPISTGGTKTVSIGGWAGIPTSAVAPA